MMKRILCLLAALVLCFVFSAAAEETAEPVTAAELGALMDRVLAEALTTNPLNDPAEESAQSEDGTCFLYENARIYADGTELTADTPVYALAFEGIEGEGPMSRFPCLSRLPWPQSSRPRFLLRYRFDVLLSYIFIK